jgi:hypothetical protein
MIVLMSSTISLSKAERVELSQRATSQAGRADDARRARLILLLEAGDTWAEIREKLPCGVLRRRAREKRLTPIFPKESVEALKGFLRPI